MITFLKIKDENSAKIIMRPTTLRHNSWWGWYKKEKIIKKYTTTPLINIHAGAAAAATEAAIVNTSVFTNLLANEIQQHYQGIYIEIIRDCTLGWKDGSSKKFQWLLYTAFIEWRIEIIVLPQQMQKNHLADFYTLSQ